MHDTATAQLRGTRPSQWEMASFLHTLRRGVLEEAALASEAIQQQWARPLADRVAAGRAIAEVEVLAVHLSGTIEVTCRVNDSRFREGDLLCLHRGDPKAEPHLLVTLEVDEEMVLVLALAERASDLDRLQSEPDGWIQDEG